MTAAAPLTCRAPLPWVADSLRASAARRGSPSFKLQANGTIWHSDGACFIDSLERDDSPQSALDEAFTGYINADREWSFPIELGDRTRIAKAVISGDYYTLVMKAHPRATWEQGLMWREALDGTVPVAIARVAERPVALVMPLWDDAEVKRG